MSGSLILEAMGFIDEALIEEGERGIPKKRPLGRWLALAACLGFVAVSAWTYEPGSRAEGEWPEEELTVESVEELPVEMAEQEASESAVQEAAVFSVTIRIEERTEDGIVGVITAVSGSERYQIGDRVRVDGSWEYKAESTMNDTVVSDYAMEQRTVEGTEYLEITGEGSPDQLEDLELINKEGAE